MSILNAIKEVKRDSDNLKDLALLPQALIMQMAQRGEIDKELVPLIIGKKAEMIEAVARDRALASSGQVPPTVMEQKMLQIAQAENPAPAPMMQPQMQPQMMAQAPAPQLPEDVGIAQNPVPPMQMAGGGIIAFDEGGDVDEDDEDREDSYILSLIQGLKPAYGSEDMAEARGLRAIEPRGLKSRLHAVIEAKESGGRRYDKSGKLLTSHKGAEGEMQVMPYTQRDPGFGVMPARGGSPDEIARVGRDYADAMLARYKDPMLAMIAYNMGPGATDRWLADGANPRKLPKETQNYIRGVSLAGGGEVKHYDIGGRIDTVGAELDALRSGVNTLRQEIMRGGSRGGAKSPELQEAYENALNLRKQKEAEYEALMNEAGVNKPSFYPQSSLSTVRPTPHPIVKRESVGDVVPKPNAPAQVPPPAADTGTTKLDTSGEGVKNLIEAKRQEITPDQELYNEIIQDLRARRAGLAEGRRMDKWQAGLAAGLGMLGGESPYAMVNIGRGGQMGVQQLADLRKLRAAEEAAISSGYGSLYKNRLLQGIKDAQLAQAARDKEAILNERRAANIEKAVQKTLDAGVNKPKLNELEYLERLAAQPKNKLEPEKVKRLEYLRKWRIDLEEGVRRRMVEPGGTSSNVIKLD